MAELTETDLREQVRERYAGHAKLATDVSPRAAREAEEACCGSRVTRTPTHRSGAVNARRGADPWASYSPAARSGVRSSGSASSISLVKISSPRL